MRVRGFLWRTVAHAAGRLAPAPMHAYHEAVTRSLVRALARDRDVIAVYGQGSYATGDLRPGRSDVDLVAVVADHDIDGELELLTRLRRAYRRRQAVLPIDLAVIPHAAFAESAALLARRRGRIATPGPMVALDRWRLLAGDELRGAPEPAHGHDWYVTEAHVARAVRALANGGDVRAALGDLIHDVERERVDWPSARRLVAARAPADLIEAALALTDAQRDLVPVAALRREVEGWSAPRPARRRAIRRARRSRSGDAAPSAVQRAPRADCRGRARRARALGRAGGARTVVDAGADLRLATPRLAEEGWRGGFRAASILLRVGAAGGGAARRTASAPRGRRAARSGGDRGRRPARRRARGAPGPARRPPRPAATRAAGGVARPGAGRPAARRRARADGRGARARRAGLGAQGARGRALRERHATGGHARGSIAR